MTADQIAALFTRPDGRYHFARWGRPIVPVVFGTDDATLGVVKGALEAVVAMAGHKMAETDPELGANLMLFFLRDWDELLAVPGLGGLVEGLEALVPRLQAQGANQYRSFRFDANGAIKAAVTFIRLDAALADLPAADLALAQAVHSLLLWSDKALKDHPPLARAGGVAVLNPDIAAVIRACYDHTMPVAARDSSHALRVAARVG